MKSLYLLFILPIIILNQEAEDEGIDPEEQKTNTIASFMDLFKNDRQS
jgi:hypothetical protein